MKILLIGEYYSNNLGDPLLCRTVERLILNSFPGSQITTFDMSGRIGYNSYFTPKHTAAAQKWFFRFSYRIPFLFNCFPFLRVLKEAKYRYFPAMNLLDSILKENTYDIAVFAGGSLFMDHFAAVLYGIVRRLNKKKIPVIFHACGMSELSKDAQVVIQKALKYINVRSISLRDSYQKFCDIFSTNARVSETYDTALACSQFYSGEINPDTQIGIGVIQLPHLIPFQKALVEAVRQYTDSWKLFTNGSSYDNATAIEILNSIGISSKEQDWRIAPFPKCTQDLVDTITSFRGIISFRMHSQIVAASFGVPSFGFVWNNKLATFYDKLGYPEHYSIPDGEIPIEKVEIALSADGGQISAAASQLGQYSELSLISEIKRILL